MKFITCFIFFTFLMVGISGALTEQQREKLKKISQKCRAQAGVSDEHFENFRSGKIDVDDKLKKHVLCVCKEIGLVKQSGEIDEDVVKNRLKKVAAEEEAGRVVGECVVKKETPEDTAAHLVGCLVKEAPSFVPLE